MNQVGNGEKLRPFDIKDFVKIAANILAVGMCSERLQALKRQQSLTQTADEWYEWQMVQDKKATCFYFQY